MSCSSSTEAPPGFTIRGVLGHGPRGTVYIATQTSLARDVALKVYRSREGPGPWPDHPGVARLHAAGTTQDGAFTASQLAPGGSLAARLAAGDVGRDEALAWCDQARRTLGELDVAHGALGPGNVLVDAHGRALLCDFGMPGVVASAAADREALAALRARCAALPARRPRRRRRAATAVAVAGLVVATAAIVAGRGDGDPAAAPRPLPGAAVLGSSLEGPAPATLGCDGRPPSGSAPTCTVVPLRRSGGPVAFRADGVVRRWAVRGARGELSLQVVRPAGRGRYVVAANGQRETVAGPGVHAFRADLPVRRGDLAAVALHPLAGIGATPGARHSAARFVGLLRFEPARPVAPTGTALDAGIELRVEQLAGVRPRPVPSVQGAAARRAPAGRRLAAGTVELTGGAARTLAVVETDGRIAIDLLGGRTRLARVDVVGADPAGAIATFEHGGTVGVPAHLAWRNPGGRLVTHDFRVRAGTLVPID